MTSYNLFGYDQKKSGHSEGWKKKILLNMDDIKLYARSEWGMDSLIQLTRIYSKDIIYQEAYPSGWDSVQLHHCRVWTRCPQVLMEGTTENGWEQQILWGFKIQTDE